MNSEIQNYSQDEGLLENSTLCTLEDPTVTSAWAAGQVAGKESIAAIHKSSKQQKRKIDGISVPSAAGATATTASRWPALRQQVWSRKTKPI